MTSPPQKPNSQRVATFISLLIVALVLFPLLRRLWHAPVRVFDEGILLVYPPQILRGLVPNLDFFSVYPPGNFWLIAIAYKVLGVSVAAERVVGAFYRVILVTGVFAI